MPKLALRAQTVDMADLPLRQDVLKKNGSMNRSKKFRFGQQPVKYRPHWTETLTDPPAVLAMRPCQDALIRKP
jgi:hypothetical protein